jgi:hypothetical protein
MEMADDVARSFALHAQLSENYCDVHAVGQQSTVETLVYNRCVATE